jgi:YgiT-type zinc finger domain-containing protein
MNGDEHIKRWHVMSEEVISGMAEWRQQNPKATFREIEEEVDKRLSELRVRMMTDAALLSAQAEWEEGSREVVCPKCGAELVKKGKKKRKLQTRGGQEVELEREYGVCPQCGEGIFPPG